jgi:hypothetical protein
MSMKSRTLRGLVAVAVLAATACGAEQADAGTAASGTALSIASPARGDTLTLPFTVQLDSSVPLAAPETGENHVHIFFDGDDSEYVLAYGTSVEVTELPANVLPGPHVLNASLRNADHSAAGVETQVEVVVGTGGAPADNESSGGDYGY